MRSLEQIKASIMREFWYGRGEGLINQLCLVDDLITKVKLPFVERYLQERRYKIGEKLEMADRNFWYYSARDGKTF